MTFYYIVPNIIPEFYILYTLNHKEKDPVVQSAFDIFVKRLSAALFDYTFAVCLGEARYSATQCEYCLDYRTFPFTEFNMRYCVYAHAHEYNVGNVLVVLEELFSEWWEENYGGESWKTIVEVLREYYTGKLSDIAFIDTCFGIEHNTGIYLDKEWLFIFTRGYDREFTKKIDISAEHTCCPILVLDTVKHESIFDYDYKSQIPVSNITYSLVEKYESDFCEYIEIIDCSPVNKNYIPRKYGDKTISIVEDHPIARW